MVLHLEQMDELGHLPALLDNLVSVLVRVGHEFLDRLLVSKHAVLVVIFEYT